MKKTILNAFIFSFIFGVMMLAFYLAAKARLPDNNGLTADSGDVLTAEKWNNLVPAKTIIAVYDSVCPTGRKPADGTDSTPDLRGVFLRGLNTFDGGTTTNARDPDCVSRSGGCAVGSYQADHFKAHNHTVGDSTIYRRTGGGAAASQHPDDYQRTKTTSNAGGNETRGKNVAVIYCMKK